MSDPVVQKAVESALQAVKDNFPQPELKGPEKQKELKEAAEAVAQEQVSKKSVLASDPDPAKVASHLSEYLSPEQIQMIKTGLQIPSYRINFRFEKGHYHADTSKSGEKYMESVKLDTPQNFQLISARQIGSIVVEAIGLVLSIVGYSVEADKMAEVATQVEKELAESPTVVEAVDNLKRVFSSGAATKDKAIAIWGLLKSVWEVKEKGELFIEIVKLLFANLTFWEKAKIVAKVTATLVAALGSDGVALVAKISLALMSAYEFNKKLSNLNELDEIRKAVQV